VSPRRPFVAGNWKMNLDRTRAASLARAVRARAATLDGVDVALFPPFVYLADVAAALSGSRVRAGAQDLHPEPKGAFTGEVSGPMIRDVGGALVLVGHSERRHGLGESDAFVAKKLRAALEHGLEPILCVGEKLDEREAGRTKDVLARQIGSALAEVSPADLDRVTIAYEPVWAIGTGRNATPEQASEAHRWIRGLVRERFGADAAARIRIQYGGSVTAENAASLLRAPDVDGSLVGGASLDSEAFGAILDAGCGSVSNG
jgi:triosephosphate isomerase